ncbi:hypothetical protein C471_02615 [Halorubrum saccharovorum DSM 1137]|uniref:DUF7969 domain-containing protein n=1 Tax=Halorubrum saccharovorum DSM 1137 TaxID=1227484 RepID=M0E8X7_9EURY|nr:hypothetical protein [Halorubrum saccharovorum]ELZ42849.1 hypothetical protein C471_02615 [Halorubrum saccharovorum DSM 1137]
MSYPVTYYCPHCGTLVELERDGYLADKSVTPYPLEGWAYVAPTDPFEGDDADGVRFVCGESDGVDWDPHDGVRGPDVGGGEPYREPDAEGDEPYRESDAEGVGCGEPFYLSFVRYEEGSEIDPRAESELVEIDPDPRPRGPRGPGGPSGPDGSGGGSDGGFW